MSKDRDPRDVVDGARELEGRVDSSGPVTRGFTDLAEESTEDDVLVQRGLENFRWCLDEGLYSKGRSFGR